MSNDLGIDRSGNGNNWTVNNMAFADQMVDSPTNNFATSNSLVTWGFDDNVGIAALSEGNLKVDSVVAQVQMTKVPFTMAGKMYFEVNMLSQHYQVVGIGEEMWGGQSGLTDNSGNIQDGLIIYVNAGAEYLTKAVGGTRTDGSENDVTVNAGDIIQYAYDADTGKAWVGINNTWHNSGNPSTGSNPFCTFPDASRSNIQPAGSDYTTGSGFIWNFGQDSSFAGTKTAQGNQDGNSIGDFYYTPPTDFLALCTSNLPDVAVVPSEHFNTVLYTGNSSTNAITGVGFQPDFTWFKARSDIRTHSLVDSVRGFNGSSARVLQSGGSGSNAEWESAYINSLDSDGFTLSGTENYINNSSHTYVAWNWKANGSGSANTVGTINSTVSVNTDAGFSIVSYTGNGSDGATVGHGLSSAPDMVIVKSRDSVHHWSVGHVGLGTDEVLLLSSTAAKANCVTGFSNGGVGARGATTFTLEAGTSDANNVNTNTEGFIAYCFHSVDGYSKVGSYTGNGVADGTFVYTGFRPAYVMMKRSDSASSGHWLIKDSKRDEFNSNTLYVTANQSNAESDNTVEIDYLSNGFKQRSTNNVNNADSSIYVFIAFAETPFKYSNAR